jgi:Tol biopolymer transport system component
MRSLSRPRIEALEDRTLPAVELLSPLAIGGGTATGASNFTTGPGAVTSANSRYVVYHSTANDLVTDQNDSNGGWDVFLHDRVANSTILVSRASGSETTTSNGDSFDASISKDGRYIAFRSSGTNLIANQNDTNGGFDVFLFDRVAETMTLVSRASSSSARTGNGETMVAAINGAGSHVVFTSTSTNHVTGQSDGNSDLDVFLFSRTAGTVKLISHTGDGVTTGNAFSDSPSINDEGDFIAFRSMADDLVDGLSEVNGDVDVFLWTGETDEIALVSHSNASTTTTGDRLSETPVISSDGQWIAFTSYALDLAPNQVDTNGNLDVFLYERATGDITLVSINAVGDDTGDNFSDMPVLSEDGRYLAYRSAASNLVTDQTDDNGDSDVFLFDREAGTTTLVSHSTSGEASAGDGFSDSPSISADGNFIAFSSVATNLVEGVTDTNSMPEVFVWSRSEGTTRLLSHSVTDEMTAGDDMSERPRVSSGGGAVVWQSFATNLVADDGNGDADIFAIALPNTAPVADAGEDTTVAEGGTVTLSGAGSTDAEDSSEDLTYEWDLDGDGVYGETGSDALCGDELGREVTFRANGLDGPDSVTVSLRVVDSGSLDAIDEVTIEVTNTAPTGSISGPSLGVRSEPLKFSLSGTDPSDDDETAGFTFEIDWGDGSSTQTVTGTTKDVEHAFPAIGEYTVTVTITDRDGDSDTVEKTVTIDDILLSSGKLSVGGTTGNDVIAFKTVTGQTGVVEVFFGTVSQGRFSGVTRIEAFGGLGNDKITVAAGITKPTWIMGGDGNDTLVGGGGVDVLIGGAGLDSLSSKKGRGVLIGGGDKDTLTGRVKTVGDGAIAIGNHFMNGSLTADIRTAIDFILSTWTSTNTLANRKAALTTYISNRVTDDGVLDVVKGLTSHDWIQSK